MILSKWANSARNTNGLLGLMLLLFFDLAQAMTLVATDDTFGVPQVEPLQVEAFGVLENDTFGTEPAGDSGASAELVSDVSNGTLSCPTNMALVLCADGSFTYSPGPDFTGTDSFTYRAVLGADVSALATVSLTACTGGPDVFACWQESSYRAKLAKLGYGVFQEGFEGSAWDVARSPSTAPSVTSQGITWTSNHPLTNNITTGSGPARTGQWGGYDPQHGLASGTSAVCDVDTPPATCFPYDGLSGSIQPGGNRLRAVGGYFSGFTGANVAIILEGTTQIEVGKLLNPGHQFIGVIDARPAGFTRFEFREIDGKIGQELFIFGDDFTIATADAVSAFLLPIWILLL